MIAENHQKNILYFKEYPCYSITTHLSEHRQMQFANVTMVEFTKSTSPTKQLPKFLIDKFQTPQKMYWLEWRMQKISQKIIKEAKSNKNIKLNQNSNLSSQSVNNSNQYRQINQYRCLYIAELGKMAHVKLVFNYDPEVIAICRDYLYTLGGNQLIITELWPENINLVQKINLTQDISLETNIPPKQSQIIHDLDSNSKILSLDFVFSQTQQVVSKIIYFNDKKGLYSRTYTRSQVSTKANLVNKLLDIRSMFKKSQECPLFYQTLVANILGIKILSKQQFVFVNLTDMKDITTTRTKLQGWQLNENQNIIIKCFKNNPQEGFNDCLAVSIGQGNNIQIYLYHIKFLQTAKLISPLDNQSRNASQINCPISYFTSSQLIDFQACLLRQFSIMNLQGITNLKNFTLCQDGLIYLGYNKQGLSNGESCDLPISGFIYYNTPYITHEILMHQNKIWKQYKIDLLLHKSQLEENQNIRNHLNRLLIPGRYDKWFILKVLQKRQIRQLRQIFEQQSFDEVNKKLAFQWRNQYEFVQFTTFKDQILIIRKNSIGSLVPISEQEFILQKDSFSQVQINYNQLQSKGFSARFDFQGNQYIDEEFSANQHRLKSNALSSNNIFYGFKTYEQKMKFINSYFQHYTQSTYFQNGLLQKSMNYNGYYDKQQVKKYSQTYKKTINNIIRLAQLQKLEKLPQLYTLPSASRTKFNIQVSQNLNMCDPSQNQLLLHLQILSLKLKDKLSFYLMTLKSFYHYHFEYLVQTAKQQQKRKNGMNFEGQDENNKNVDVTTQMVYKTHMRHIYIVYVLEWMVNVGGKIALQEQYQYFGRDLIDQFVVQYIKNYCNSQSGICPKSRYASLSNHQLYKGDIPVHLNNIFSLLFRGLISQYKPKSNAVNMSQIVQSQIFVGEQSVIESQIQELNKKSNTFILMLLKKNLLLQKSNNFITNNILTSLYTPLVIQPFNQNISSYVSINKTFVYSILSIGLTKQQKTKILSAYLDQKEFLSLLLLIQFQNNCYLNMLEQDYMFSIFAIKGQEEIYRNTVRLSRQNCCIIEQLILMNYKSFLFPQKSQSQQIKKMVQKQAKFNSHISQHERLDYQKVQKQNRTIEFIKVLFSQIDFKYISNALSKDQKKRVQSHKNTQDRNYQPSIYDNKNVIQILRGLMRQVQAVNQQFSSRKQTKIQRVFRKFYNKIFKSKHHSSGNPQTSGLKRQANQFQSTYYGSSQIYPQITGEGYGLSMWQLQKINKLYNRFLQTIKSEAKHFYSTELIQKRLNLQYSMLKIYLLRLKSALKQIQSLVEQDKKQYAKIMKECVYRIQESLASFKNNFIKLRYGNINHDESSSDSFQVDNQQLLQLFKQTDVMQDPSSSYKDCQYSQCQNQQTNIQFRQALQHQLDQKWSIIGIPISQQWLKLLRLTFDNTVQQNTFQDKYPFRPSRVFTNYHSLQSILLKILIEIKKQNLNIQQKSVQRLFGKQKVQSIIKGNQELKRLYSQQSYQGNQYKSSTSNRNNFFSNEVPRGSNWLFSQ